MMRFFLIGRFLEWDPQKQLGWIRHAGEGGEGKGDRQPNLLGFSSCFILEGIG